ncbi:MAG: CHC2 zinc finger domain-containing protein [Nitrososphaerales archaeon]
MINQDKIIDILEALGTKPSRIANGEIFASCPLPGHIDNNPSFSIRQGDWIWHCFACNEGGNLIKLVMLCLEMTKQQATEWLNQYNASNLVSYIERVTNKPTRITRINAPLTEIPNRTIDQLPICPIEKLSRWHISNKKVVEKFGLRYDANHMRLRRGDHYVGPAIIIPHVFLGKLVGIQERWLGDDLPRWLPKYTNSIDMPKSETLYGWDQAIEFYDKTVIVVESALTCIRLWSIGYPAVATFGASISIRQIGLLNSLDTICLAFDNDKAGQQTTKMLLNSLYNNVYIIEPPVQDKADLADVSDEEARALISNMKPAFMYNIANVLGG